MSEQLPYDEEQWNDLPVPDGEISWQKMQLLLDKEKKRRVIPFWLWRYAAVGLLFIGLAIGGWLWLSSGDKPEQSHTSTTQNTDDKTEKSKEAVRYEKTNGNKPSKNKPHQPYEDLVLTNESKQPDLVIPQPDKKTLPSSLKRADKERRNAVVKTKTKLPAKSKALLVLPPSQDLISQKKTGQPVTTPAEKKGNMDSLQLASQVKKDSVQTKDSLKTIISPPVVTNEDKQEQKKKKPPFVWSAGIGLQQSIAVNGQESSSFNYNGKESALSDHIPSIYLRLQKDKWFTQLEFHYAMPQPTQNFSFSQKTKYDAANSSINTERFIIQKLYYHQLPLTVNYSVLPNLSIGAGGMYNILAGAVTEQEVTSKNVLTGAESITRNVAPVKGYKDSFLYKTTAGIILQTDYHWKRFSLGLRFTQNLQPFIKYTKPDGAILDEKSQALQAILRFRLWSSR